MHPLVRAEELAARLDDPAWIVFDVRHDLTAPAAGEASYRDGHIAGARFASLDRDLSGPKDGLHGRHPLPTREAFVDFLARAGVNASSTIVAYDANNSLYASRLWWMARWVGHARVAVLDGGFAAWQAAGGAVDRIVPASTRGDIVPGESLTLQVGVDDLVADLAGRSLLVVDARSPERYRGDVEPLDPVAGHIPGAVNHPMGRSLEADGRFRSADALRGEFTSTLAGRDPTTLVQSCGSGVTACHGLLAMEIAGLPGAALYPGSWSEWCADPERPVARGD